MQGPNIPVVGAHTGASAEVLWAKLALMQNCSGPLSCPALSPWQAPDGQEDKYTSSSGATSAPWRQNVDSTRDSVRSQKKREREEDKQTHHFLRELILGAQFRTSHSLLAQPQTQAKMEVLNPGYTLESRK